MYSGQQEGPDLDSIRKYLVTASLIIINIIVFLSKDIY